MSDFNSYILRCTKWKQSAAGMPRKWLIHWHSIGPESDSRESIPTNTRGRAGAFVVVCLSMSGKHVAATTESVQPLYADMQPTLHPTTWWIPATGQLHVFRLWIILPSLLGSLAVNKECTKLMRCFSSANDQNQNVKLWAISQNDPKRSETKRSHRACRSCSQSSCGFCWNGAPWHGPWHGPWGLSLTMSQISRQHTALDSHAACWHSASMCIVCFLSDLIYCTIMQSATEMPEKLLIHW